MRLATLAFVLLLSASASAQPAPLPGSCERGTSQARLDVGDVRAEVFNTGHLFFGNQTDGSLGRRGYVVPKETGFSSIFASALWLAGTVGGEIRAVGGTYDFVPLWPGPLGDDARPVDPDDCSPYDRIYTVSRPDVLEYARSGVATDDLRDWPWQLGAPVLDGDGDPDNYNLAGGDEPALLGDQTAWWIMNDVGGARFDYPEERPLGVEVRVEAGAFAFDALRRFNQATVYRYTLTNRTAVAIDALYAGLFLDTDLGDFLDDYVGADTTREMGFTYNGLAVDDEYGIPPALGYQILEGPVGLPNGRDDDGDGQTDEPGERLGMASSSGPFYSLGPQSEPYEAPELFNRLRGRWNDGTVIRAFSDGYDESEAYPIVPVTYPGDPVTRSVWSEVNPGAGLSPFTPSDRGGFVGTGPFRLGPGESQTVTFAIPFAQGASNLDSITRLRALADALVAARSLGLLTAQRASPLPDPPPVSDAVRLSAPAPNPFAARSVLRYEAPVGTRLRATLHDVLGRRLAVLADGATEAPQGEIEIVGSRLAPGVYRVRVTVDGGGERIVTVVRAR